MKAQMVLWAIILVVSARVAAAYEYPLQFTPNAGARGLVVAGYQYSGNNVVGNCSYYTETSGSGRGGGYHTHKTNYDQTCTWDAHGNLLSVTPGAPVAPAPLYVNGTQTVYAQNGSGGFTGTDTKIPNGGFVSTPGSHYTWTTSNLYTVTPQVLDVVAATFVSDGDLPLNVSGVTATAQTGKAYVKSTTCSGQLAAGSSCTVGVLYDISKLCSTTGLAYDTVTISLTSDAPQASDFSQHYTLTITRQCQD